MIQHQICQRRQHVWRINTQLGFLFSGSIWIVLEVHVHVRSSRMMTNLLVQRRPNPIQLGCIHYNPENVINHLADTTTE